MNLSLKYYTMRFFSLNTHKTITSYQKNLCDLELTKMNYELRLTKIYEDKDRRTQRYKDRKTKKTERPKNRNIAKGTTDPRIEFCLPK